MSTPKGTIATILDSQDVTVTTPTPTTAASLMASAKATTSATATIPPADPIKEARKLKFKTILKEEIAIKDFKRAVQQFENMQGINIIKQDKENRRKLAKRLRNVEDPTLPLTDEMRSLLKKELDEETVRRKGFPQILTQAEKRIFKLLLVENKAWVLKHVTGSIEKIEKGGNTLLSLEERIRRHHTINEGSKR